MEALHAWKTQKDTDPLYVAPALDLFDCLHAILKNPTSTIQDDLIFLVDRMGAPVTDPRGVRDLVLTAVDQPPFTHQLIVTRMLVAAGAPIHKKTKDCVNSKFENLWSLIVHPAFEATYYDGPISLLGNR